MNLITRFRNRPMWYKLTMIVLFSMVLPFVVLLNVSEQQANNTENITRRQYLADIANEHKEEIEGALDDVLTALETVTSNRRYRTQLVSVLTDEDSGLLRPTVANLFANRLIDSNQFYHVRLVGLDGINVVDTRAGQFGRDESNTPSYQAGLNAQILGETQQLIVYRQAQEISVEVVQVVNSLEGEVIGFLIGAVNLDTVIYRNLEAHEGFIPVYAYLATRDGILFAEAEFLQRADSSADVSPINRATAGQEGFIEYTVEGELIQAYYLSVFDSRFALITETFNAQRYIPSLFTAIFNNPIVLLGLIFLGVIIGMTNAQIIASPIRQLNEAVVGLMDNQYDIPLDGVNLTDEIGDLSRSVSNLRQQVKQLISDQDSTLQMLTRDIRATQEVARYAASQRDQQELMDEVVSLILRQFPNIYHAQIFLIDQDNKYAILRASTGKPGRQLLARGHRLAVGSTSVIGQVTKEGRTVVARDTASSQIHRRNEFLPDTRAELAIPLRIGEQIIGALDVQSRESESFSQDQINILSTMADQIAISLDNARLYQESLQRLQQINESNRRTAQLAWEDYLNDMQVRELVETVGLMEEDYPKLREQAIETEKTAIGELSNRNTVPFAVPIILRGQALGAVMWELPANDINHDKIQLAEELVNRLAITLDNARLFQTSQRSAERERVVNDIASKITGKTNIDDILQTAVREVGQALGAPEVKIRLNLSKMTSQTTSAPMTE